MQPMDLVGPWEVIATWKNLYPNDVEMHIVGENIGPVKCLNNITLESHFDFASAPQANYLFVPGGFGRIKQMHNPQLINFIQQQAKHCKYTIAACTGTFLLAAADLLKNKKVTTYWRALPELETYEEINICEQRVVKDNNFWSSGGISSGIDLAFSLINDIAGEEIAGQVQLMFEYFPDTKLYAKNRQLKHIPRYPTLSEHTPIRLPTYIRKELED